MQTFSILQLRPKNSSYGQQAKFVERSSIVFPDKEKVPENLLTSKKVMFLLFCFLEQMLKRATDRQR